MTVAPIDHYSFLSPGLGEAGYHQCLNVQFKKKNLLQGRGKHVCSTYESDCKRVIEVTMKIDILNLLYPGHQKKTKNTEVKELYKKLYEKNYISKVMRRG